jgi:uncharacterized protein YigE (DUF2233 family)
MIRALLIALLLPTALTAGACEDVSWEDNSFTICHVSIGEPLRLFLKTPDGDLYGHFRQIETELEKTDQQLGFAMNAGMYHSDRAPVGHYVEDSKEVMRVVSRPGPGNFGLLPNGIFCIRSDRFDVIETLSFVEQNPNCAFATQSGPMLVIDGDLHPRFLEDGTSRYIRNGVGTSANGSRAVFAISNNSVNFHTFGRFFRDFLELPQALYFDGNISRLHAPGLNRSDPGFALGPIVGTVIPID